MTFRRCVCQLRVGLDGSVATSTKRSGKICQQGVTFLETVVAAVVLGVLLALSVPLYLGHLADRALQNAAHLIQADLRLAQQAAISRAGSGPRVEVCFRDDGYDIYAVDFEDSMTRGGEQKGAILKVANKGQEYSADTVTVEQSATFPCLQAPGRAINFSGAGAPVSFADPSPKSITLTLRGRTYTVTITPTTGAVTVSQ